MGARSGKGQGRGPRTRGPGGGVGKVGEGFPRPGGREEGWERSRDGSRDQGAGRRGGKGGGRVPGTRGPGGGVGMVRAGVPGPFLFPEMKTCEKDKKESEPNVIIISKLIFGIYLALLLPT